MNEREARYPINITPSYEARNTFPPRVTGFAVNQLQTNIEGAHVLGQRSMSRDAEYIVASSRCAVSPDITGLSISTFLMHFRSAPRRLYRPSCLNCSRIRRTRVSRSDDGTLQPAGDAFALLHTVQRDSRQGLERVTDSVAREWRNDYTGASRRQNMHRMSACEKCYASSGDPRSISDDISSLAFFNLFIKRTL